ncbi:MAG TPA: MOSC domain-containing protein [Nitrososphaeraceae archaeon]|nr:MOSC domain-containing protein [Nitrososphaeraceae archaeon]
MKLISLNVGIPRQVTYKSELVTTGIFKEPIHHRTILRKLNLDGDKQADLTVHGGLDKAVYSYPAEHYGYWQKELPGMYLSWGMFGENFTTEGLFEDNVNIGDQFQIGSAIVIATQPRMPCYKLGVKFGRMDIVKRFLASGLTGIYFKVLQEGEVGAGDVIKLIRRDDNNVTVKDVIRIYSVDKDDVQTLERAIKVKDLPDGWRSHFIEQLDQSKK